VKAAGPAGSSQYFALRPQVSSRPQRIRARLRGREWVFMTDRGVFGRGAVDPGTRLLIETMHIAPADQVLDVGCGYGPVGLAAAALASNGLAVLVDVNERAVDLAAQNARLNNVSNVEILLGDGGAPVAGRMFDVVVTNPPIRAGRATLMRLVRDAWDILKPGGRLVFVVRTAQGAKTLAREVAAIFGTVTELAQKGGYRVYETVKGTAAREPTRKDV
jgi:16S rRNA (guanine1207-N2)-methyltransferase